MGCSEYCGPFSTPSTFTGKLYMCHFRGVDVFLPYLWKFDEGLGSQREIWAISALHKSTVEILELMRKGSLFVRATKCEGGFERGQDGTGMISHATQTGV